jgi:S1-C subfamily serine protease
VPAAVPTPAPVASIPSSPSNPDPEEIVRRIKDATVLIKRKIGSRTIGNGSGFVIEVNGDTVMVATNGHVALVDLATLPPGLVPLGSKPQLEAVFRSGLGPQEEQVLPAEIIAADPTEEYATDLAFLVVKGVKRPPAPIDPMVPITPSEGMTYIGAGFPLGGMLNSFAEKESTFNPSVTITRGGIAALRRDAYGQLAVLQVDGSLQPGNSGGPILDARTGKLIGVAEAKVTAVDTIGIIVPEEEVRRSLAGRLGPLDLTLEPSSQQGTANLLVKAILVDPKWQVGGVVVHAASASAVGTLNPDRNGIWPPLPNTKPFELQRDARTPVASGHVQIALGGEGGGVRKIVIQAAHRDLRGRLFYSKPQEVLLPEQPGPIRPAGSLARVIPLLRRKSLSLLGTLIDPSRDCRLDKDDKSFKVRINIPGKLHTHAPKLTARSSQPLHNAPMTLTDVEGDFAAVVEVTGDINPGSTPPNDRQARGLAFTFQSAGLILYQDKNNYFRFERSASVVSRSLTPLHRLVIEAVKDGKQAMDPIYLPLPEGDTLLILARRKGRVRCLFVPHGSRQMLRFRDFALTLPPKVKVGLTASNISAQPFSATFENFTLQSDAVQIDEELGD